MTGTFQYCLLYICPNPGNIADKVAAFFGFNLTKAFDVSFSNRLFCENKYVFVNSIKTVSYTHLTLPTI